MGGVTSSALPSNNTCASSVSQSVQGCSRPEFRAGQRTSLCPDLEPEIILSLAAGKRLQSAAERRRVRLRAVRQVRGPVERRVTSAYRWQSRRRSHVSDNKKHRRGKTEKLFSNRADYATH